MGVGLMEVHIRRNSAVVNCQRRFNEPGNSGGRFSVAYV